MADNDDTHALDIASPPWWDQWQAWCYAPLVGPEDPRYDGWIDGDPRRFLQADDLYELGSEAYEAGYTALLDQLLACPTQLDQLVLITTLAVDHATWKRRRAAAGS